MADEDPLPYYWLDLVSVGRLIKHFITMAATIYIWDYILMFSMEVDLVWKSKWNFTKGLYLFQRYMPFIDISISLYFLSGKNLTRSACRKLIFSSGALMTLGLVASEMIFMLRTWAVWNRNWRLTIILPILFALMECSSFVIMNIYYNSVKFNDPPYPGFAGCFPINSHKYDLVFLSAISITWDSLMLILMLVPGIRAFRAGGNSALVNTVYRNGVIYYLYLFVLSLINILILTILPNQQFLLMTARVLRTILSSRVLLDIRAQTGEKLVRSDGLTELSTDHLRTGNTQSSRLESIRFSTTKRSSL